MAALGVARGPAEAGGNAEAGWGDGRKQGADGGLGD